MTSEELLSLLDFEKALQAVEILSQTDLGNGATFIVAKLHYSDDFMTVSFVHYDGKEWIFTPQDWQEWMPETPEEITEINWRIDDTETYAVLLDGVPALTPWAPEPPNPKRAARKMLGRQLKEAREDKGLSVRQLAGLSGINKSQICRVEAGRLNVGIDTITALADALGLKIELR